MKKPLCIILLLSILNSQFSIVYAQENTNDEEPTQTTSVTEEDDSYGSGVNPQQRFEDNPKYNVHEYDYKQQVIVGGTIMFCVALSLIVNNNYNPKRGK